MPKRFPALLALAVVLALPVTQFAVPPTNLSTAKRAVAEYVSSGEYGREVAAVALKANKYLAKRIAKPAKPNEKRAIVFDIDETTLSNLPHIMAHDYGYVPGVWRRWVAEGQARAIVPVQLVYDLAVKNGVTVFFITGRNPVDAPATERNLREVGYESWSKIYYKPEGDEISTAAFKRDTRRQLIAEGYTIIANIGDQDSDLTGDAAERIFKLPNPFYIVK
ncbi:MAG TPA: HAD family acid phosphatase [Lacunisphaera sp.]